MEQINATETYAVPSSHPQWLMDRLGQAERLAPRGTPIHPGKAKAIYDRLHMDGVASIEGGGVVRAVILGPDPDTYEGVAVVFIEGGVEDPIVVRGKSIQGVDFERAFYDAIARYRTCITSSNTTDPRHSVPRPDGKPAPSTQLAFDRPLPLPKLLASDPVDRQIQQAVAAGVVLDGSDVSEIRRTLASCADLERKARRKSQLSADPMKKGNAFPMGVGFTRMTKRASQRIDASVRRAGEASDLYRRANTARAHAQALLGGIGTTADKQRQNAARSAMQRRVVADLLRWKRGESIGGFLVTRVSRDQAGYPSSYTIAAPGIVKGVCDKVNVVKDLFGGNADLFRSLVDIARQVERDLEEWVAGLGSVRA